MGQTGELYLADTAFAGQDLTGRARKWNCRIDRDVLDAHTQFSVYAEPSSDPGYDTQERLIPSATAQAGE